MGRRGKWEGVTVQMSASVSMTGDGGRLTPGAGVGKGARSYGHGVVVGEKKYMES